MSNSCSSHCFYDTKNVTFNSPETNYEKGIAINAIMCERMSFMCKWFKHSQLSNNEENQQIYLL